MPEASMTVTRILGVHHSVSVRWSRPHMIPRPVDGIALLTEGSILYHFEDMSRLAGPGDVVAFPKGVRYSGEVRSPTQSFYFVDFETDMPDAFARMELPRVLPGQEALTPHFVRMERAMAQDITGAALLVMSDVYAILARLVIAARQDHAVRRTDAITAYIRGCFQAQSFSVAGVARHFHLSESQLRRIFARELGMSPAQYAMDLRLQLAKSLLMYEQCPVKEVAYLCGFSSEYYFSRLFRQKVGVAPSQYV